jgi:hypothetical protein
MFLRSNGHPIPAFLHSNRHPIPVSNRSLQSGFIQLMKAACLNIKQKQFS